MNYIQKEIHLFKMVITLFICILFYVCIGEKNYDIILIACYASIFGIQEKTAGIELYGIHRLVGTFIGGVFVIGYIYVYNQLSKAADVRYLLLVIPMLILVASMLVGGFQKRSAAVMGITLTIVTMGLLVLKTNQITYLSSRMLATIVGVLSSIVTNIAIHVIKNKLLEKKNRK